MDRFNRKLFPEKITKKFLFEAYGVEMSEKYIRAELNHLITLLGGNKRKRIVSEVVYISFIKRHWLPYGYYASDNLRSKLKKVGYTSEF